MTIERAPTFLDDIQPGVQNLQYALPRLLNPHYDQQQVLKKKLAEDPTLAQKLVDMGPQEVDAIYGKNAHNLYDSTANISPQKSLEITTRKAQTAANNDPNSRFNRQQVAAATNTQTTEQNVLQDEAVKRAPLQTALAGSEATIAASGAKVAAAEEPVKVDAAQRERDASLTYAKVSARPGTGDLYQASQDGTITPQELASMRGSKIFDTRYEQDERNHWRNREEHWQGVRAGLDQQRINIEQTRANRESTKASVTDYLAKRTAASASEIAERYGSDPASVMSVLQNSDQFDKYKDMKVVPPTTDTSGNVTKPGTDPADAKLATAAQSLAHYRSDMGAKPIRMVNMDYQRQISGYIATIKSRTSQPEDKQAAVERMNDIARTVQGPYTDNPTILALDKAGAASKSGSMFTPDVPELRVISGDKRFGFGAPQEQATPVAGAATTTQGTPSTTPAFDEAAWVKPWNDISMADRIGALNTPAALANPATRNKTKAMLIKNKLIPAATK